MGMHRSGTSAMTGALNKLGVYLGEHMMQPHATNEKGFFENMDIAFVNRYIMEYKLGRLWHTTEEVPVISSPEINDLLEFTIKDTLGDAPVAGIKDPRMCFLLPYYQEVLTKLDYEIFYLRTHRDENEIKASLMYRDKFNEEKCDKIISLHNASLDKYIPDAITIRYVDLLNDTDNVIGIMQQHFPFLDYSESNKQEVKSFLDIKLKHN